MLHPAGLPFRGLGIDPGRDKLASKEAVFLIGLLGYLPAYISQVQGEVFIHRQEAAFFQGRHRMTHAGLGHLHVPGHIHGAHHALFLLEHQHGLQVVLARRVKISGEALAGDKHTGLDFEVIGQVCDVIKECLDMGVQVGLVVGGGNFWRGAKNSGGAMERTRADHMGMLATVMNCLAVADVCEQKGIPVRVQTAIEMRAVAEPYIRSRAIRHLEKGRVVIFGAGTGNPYFSTDTAAVLRAAEIDADVILLAKNVDGVYTADPVKDPTAVKYDVITYDDVLAQHLAVMDSTATSLSMDNHIPVLLFALKDPRNIIRALCGENVGTIVKE